MSNKKNNALKSTFLIIIFFYKKIELIISYIVKMFHFLLTVVIPILLDIGMAILPPLLATIPVVLRGGEINMTVY